MDAGPREPRLFLLSPADCRGVRAGHLFRPEATFDLAVRLRSAQGAPIGEVYAFLSGLYFRGKLAYARAFAHPTQAVRLIVPGRGLLPAGTPVTTGELRAIAEVPVSLGEPRYLEPLERDAAALTREYPAGPAVLLGSIATGKYLDVLARAFGPRLRFPLEFVGRGDMSRGGLMLRCAEEGRELHYVALEGAVRHGPRPPRLEPRRRATGT